MVLLASSLRIRKIHATAALPTQERYLALSKIN